jgi:hypothetical protein
MEGSEFGSVDWIVLPLRLFRYMSVNTETPFLPNCCGAGKYSSFTDKVERDFHFPASGWNCCNLGKLILLFYGAILDSCLENTLALSDV